MSRRGEILQEMGLAPVWRLRSATAPVPEESTSREQRILGMQWHELKQAVPACTACALHATRTQSVLGVIEVVTLDGEPVPQSPLVEKIHQAYCEMLARP